MASDSDLDFIPDQAETDDSQSLDFQPDPAPPAPAAPRVQPAEEPVVAPAPPKSDYEKKLEVAEFVRTSPQYKKLRESADPVARYLGQVPDPNQSDLSKWAEAFGVIFKNLPRLAGKGLGFFEKGTGAVVGKVAGTGDTIEDVGRAIMPADIGMGQPLPVEEAVANIPGKRGTLARIGLGLAESAPKIAMIPSGEGIPALLTSSAVAGGLFGLDAQGNFHPKEAAIGALLPGAGKLAHNLVAKGLAAGLKSGLPLLDNAFAQKAIESLGSQAALNVVQLAGDSPELIELYKADPEKAKQRVEEIIGQNLAFELLGIRKWRGAVPSETESFIVKNAEKYGDLADRFIARGVVGKEGAQAIAEAIEQARQPRTPTVRSSRIAPGGEEDRFGLRKFSDEQMGMGPQPFVPPESGPLRTIPDVRKQPGRLRVSLPARPLIPPPTLEFQERQPSTTGDPNAVKNREEQPPVQLPGVTPGSAVPANEEEIRQAASEQTGGGDSAQASGNVPQEKAPDSVAEPVPAAVTPARKAAATREGNRTPDLIDWIEGNYPKGIRVSSAKEFGSYVDRARGAAKKILFKEKPGLETADTVMRAAADEGYVFGSEDEFLQAVLDAGASREENAARQKREAEAGERAGRFQAATQKGKLVVSPEKLKVGDVVTVERERLTVKRIDAGSGEVTLRGGEKFGEQTVRFGQKFYAQRFEAAKGRESRIAGDLFEGTQREPAVVEKPEAAPVSGVKESPPADTGGAPEQVGEPIVAEGLTLAEIKRRLPVGFDEASVRIENGRIVAKEKPGYGERWMFVSLKKAESEPYAKEAGELELFTAPRNQEGKALVKSEGSAKLSTAENKELSGFVLRDRAVREEKEGAKPLTSAERQRYDELMAKAGQEELPMAVPEKVQALIPPEPEAKPTTTTKTTTKTPKEQEAEAIQSMRDFAGSLTPEQERAIAAAQKYRVKNAGPQTFSIVERLAQSEAEKEASEQPVKIKNDKTGKEEVVLEADLQPVKTRTAAEREANKGMSRKELDEALLKAGMEPSEFPDAASKRAALKRFRAKGGKASLAEAFYSRITRAVEDSKQGKATGAQWKATIRNSKAGISKDEWALVSVDDLQDGKAYTKQEVLDYLKANQVTVKDVTLGNDTKPVVMMRFGDIGREQQINLPGHKLMDRNDWVAMVDGDFAGTADGMLSRSEAKRQINEDRGGAEMGGAGEETFFSQYTLPGAKEGSYREVLLTVPQRNPFNADAYNAAKTSEEREQIRNAPRGYTWTDGHQQYGDIPNPVVRLRFNERTTADGKRMLFLEEVQPPQKGNFEKMPALFQKQWREVAFKWALRHAAENGFDSIGWTTGEHQAERYDLSKQIDSVSYHPESKILQAFKGSEVVIERHGVEPEQVENYVGKEAAKQLSLSKPDRRGFVQISGQQLKVGGDGLKKLYDQDFRNVVNSLAPVKKAGQKVGTGSIEQRGYFVRKNGDEWSVIRRSDATREGVPFRHKEQAEQWIKEHAGSEAVHALDITPEMKESVMLGQAQFHLDNEGQGGVRHEDAAAEVERARSKYPDAPPMQIVDRPDWVALGEDGNHYGIKGLWHNGRIWLNKAYLKDALDARATLEHEMVHPLLETKEGVKAVEEALRNGLGRANMDALIRRYGDRYAAQEEWFAGLAEKNQSLWKRIVDHVRVFLSKVGLVNLSDEEIGRGIVRMLRSGRSDAGGPVYGSLIEPSDLSKASLTGEPVEEPGPAAEEAPRRNRHQVAGVKQLGSEYEVENIERIRGAVRAQFFDGSQPISEGMSEAAWNMLQDLTDPGTRQGNAEQVRNLAGGEMAPGLLRNELWNYALRLSFQQRDPSLLRFMVERNQDIATLGGGGSDTQAGRALRAAQDRATGPLWANLVELTRQRAISGARALGVGEDLFNELLGTIDSLDISAEDLERIVVTGTDTRGRPVREVFEEMSPEAREAERILDQYERSQTEWLKPEKQLSIIRQIIRDSIQGGPAARYRQQAEFVDFVSRRFQEATVPKEIADRLAFEVWKDKQAREASATAKAIRGEETREQRNAETLLDQWAKEQTEWVKPERRNQTKDIIKEFMARNVDKNNPDAFRSPLAERLRGIGVPEAVAREVAVQAWNRKLTFDDAKLARALEIERDRAAKQAERIAQSMVNRLEASQTEWVKPDGAPTVAKIIAEALRPLSAGEKRELKELSVGRDTPEKQARYDALRGRDVLPEADPASFMAPLRGKLVAAGVTEATAYRLAREIYNKRVTDWTTARARAMERASESGSLRSLIEAIKGSPYRAQKDAAWRLKTATDWFMSNGLAREQAEAAAKLFDAQFATALASAAERNAQRILKDKEPKTLRDVIQAIRAGLTDPDKSWPDEIAKREGYKPLTKEQHARIAELEAKLSAPEISTAEQVQITEQIMGVFRHAGWKEGATARFIAGSYANSLLSGIRTAALHVFQPMSSLLLRDVPLFVTQNLHRPRDILTAGRTVIEAAKTWFPEAKFAWQNDAYTFSSHEMSLMHNELKRQYEIAKGELSSKSPKGILKGALRMLYAWQHFVTRVLQTANQAGMAITRDVKLALYGSTAMKEAGLSTKEISELVDVAIEAKNAAYEDALLRGMDKTTAAVVADERANDALAKFFSNAVGDQKGREIMQAAENDAYSIVGRRAPGISEEDEGWASKPITGLMQAITKMRARSGQESMLTIAMFGFVNVPLRLARYHLNSGPYALLRYGIDRYRAAHGKETFWKQSFANSLQVKQRLLEGLFGTGLMVGGGLLAAQFHSSDEDLQKRHWGVYFTGAGPKSRVLRDAWQKRGFRPYSIQFVVGGTMVNFPLTRVGQVFAQPFALAATMDDAEWARKEAAAAGKEVPQKISQTLGLGVGNYYHMVLGDMGLFQAGEHMVRLGRGEKNIGSAVADQLSGVAAATVIPGKQLLSNISEMIFGPLDRSSVQSSIAANFPVLGAHWQQKAINRFGDQLYDQSLYGKVSKLGIPFAVRVSDTPENRQLYGLMVNKGAAAPDLRRYVIEEKYGPLSDEQWSKFAKISGNSLKKSVLSSLEGLKDAPAEEVKKFLVKMGSVANQEAAAELALNPVKVSQREFSGGAAGADVKINTSGRGIPGPVGESGGIGRVTPAKIPGSAGAGAGYGRRLGTRTGVSRGLRGPGASGSGLRGRRLVSGKLRARSGSGGRLRRIGVAKTHRRRLSLA